MVQTKLWLPVLIGFYFVHRNIATEGICTRSKQIAKKKPVQYTETYLETYQGLLNTKTRVATRTVPTYDTSYEYVNEDYCCLGFTVDATAASVLKCNPVCSKICINGYCSSPETCKCNQGFVLSLDNITCTKSLFQYTRYNRPPFFLPPLIVSDNRPLFYLSPLKVSDCRLNCIHGNCINQVCFCMSSYYGRYCNITFASTSYNSTYTTSSHNWNNHHMNYAVGGAGAGGIGLAFCKFFSTLRRCCTRLLCCGSVGNDHSSVAV